MDGAITQPDLLEAATYAGECQTCGMVTCQCERQATPDQAERPAGLLGVLEREQPGEPGEAPVLSAVEGLDLATIAKIYASASVGRFLSTRVDQALRHGHTPEKDSELQPFWLPREAHNRLIAVLDDIGRDQGGPARSQDHLARRKQALKRLEIAGALLMAGHDVLAGLIEQGVRP